MRTHVTNDWEYVQSHPNTRFASRGTACHADTQHTTPADHSFNGQQCLQVGIWRIKGYQHLYCTVHAAVIVKARDQLFGGRTRW